MHSFRRLTLFLCKGRTRTQHESREDFIFLHSSVQDRPAHHLSGARWTSVRHCGPSGVPATAQSAKTWDKRGQDAERRHDYDAAYEAYRQATLSKPKDLRYRAHFELMRFQAAVSHVDRGRVLRQSGDLQGAFNEFSRALAIDGGNQTAQQELDRVTRELTAQASAAAPPPGQQIGIDDLASLSGVASPIDL